LDPDVVAALRASGRGWRASSIHGIPNPPEMWIRKEDAFAGIVPKEIFASAPDSSQIYNLIPGTKKDQCYSSSASEPASSTA